MTQIGQGDLGPKTVVWTDGSCNASGIHGRGGWAALIEQEEAVREISGSADGTTHNRMELTAICEALEGLTGPIEVRTDSTYVEKCFNQKWHERWLRDRSWKGSNGPVKNRDLWERLFGLVWDGKRDVTFIWIKGHAGDANNHWADRLARAAAVSAGSRIPRDSVVTEHVATVAKARKRPAWRDLPPAEMAEHLLSTSTLANITWTAEPRKRGEKRDAFIRRILLGEAAQVEAPEYEIAKTDRE
jgi:ribonuclease HI